VPRAIRIIEASVPLVLVLVRKYHNRYLDRNDLIQEGVIGLCIALDR